MYEIKLFDGGTKPWILIRRLTEADAIKLAKSLVKGEDLTWRAEVWTPEGKMIHLAQPTMEDKK